jgi:hypothetical protein
MSSPDLFGYLESYIPGLDGSIQNRVSSRYLRESPGSASERVFECKNLVLEIVAWSGTQYLRLRIEERLDDVRYEGEHHMNATDQKKCAHPQCSCQVSQGEEYCSEACEISAAGSEANAECGCDHPQCEMAA